MKKLVLISIVLCITASVNSQIRFGVKAGGNFTNLYTSGSSEGINANNFKGRVGYHFGGVMEYSLTDMFSIQPELMYLNHGANLKSNNSLSMKDGHATLNTLQLPINVKATFETGKSKLFVYAGPYVGYNMYGKIKGKVDGLSVSNELYAKGSAMRRLDYGVGIGVGIEINKFVLSLGNQFGLQDISGSEKGKMTAGNLSLSAGYFF